MHTTKHLFSLVNTEDFKNVLYTNYTGNKPTSKRVDQVFKSVEHLIYYLVHILSNTEKNHYRFLHSSILQSLFTSHKYKAVIDTLKKFKIIEVFKNLAGRETYVPLSAEKIFGIRAHTKAYRTTQKWFQRMKKENQNISVQLTKKELKRIRDTFQATLKLDENSETLTYLQECMEMVQTSAEEKDIKKYLNGDLEKSSVQASTINNVLQGKRKASTGKGYYNRIHTNLGGCPKTFRHTFRSNDGEKMVGVDGSNFQPFILMNIYYDAMDGDFDIQDSRLSQIIADGKFYSHITELIEKEKGVTYSIDQIKKPVLKMINRDHSKQIQYLNDEICEHVELAVRNEYPMFYSFLRELNRKETLYDVYGYSVAKSIINQGKENTSSSYIYADYETSFMVEVLKKVEKQFGVISLYTAYDCLYVPESYADVIRSIMEDVSREMHYCQATFTYEGIEDPEINEGKKFSDSMKDTEIMDAVLDEIHN